MARRGCVSCEVASCYRREVPLPGSCVTRDLGARELRSVVRRYVDDPADRALALAAAEIEGRFYGRLTRVEEIVEFARSIGARRIGIATCIGLLKEARLFSRILERKGLQSFGVICKVGSVDKTEVGVPEELKVEKGRHEAICNPIAQARLLNREHTDLNVVIGLCVGHDALFFKHSTAPATTLITKDRVLGHNPAAALYASHFYYRRLLAPDAALAASREATEAPPPRSLRRPSTSDAVARSPSPAAREAPGEGGGTRPGGRELRARAVRDNG